MTVEQASQDLLETLDLALYMNDFGGFQCNRDDAMDIEGAIDTLEKALAQTKQREWVELTRGDIISMEIPADASIVDIAWAIEAIIKKKNT
jgi:hypothetical protein